ncbi:MAG: selenium metabolism-associated LysR family transcriptional regulator [Pirellulales bacterium]
MTRWSKPAKIQGMELRHLRTFLIAAEMQSFTRAAEVLGVTQAAVSQHVAALEMELSVSLFKRASRTVVPTEAGRTLYDYARRIVDLADEAYDTITHAPNIVRGTLKIAASTVPSEWLLPELLVGFRRLYPHVQEFVSVSDSASAIRAVESGEAELGIVGELPRAARLCAKAIASDELTLVVPPDHAFASAKKVTLDAFCREPLIVRGPNSGSRRCVEQALSRAGLSPNELTITMEVNSNEAIRAAVERGVAIAFLSTRAVSREIQDGRLASVEIEAVKAERSLYLVTDPQRMPTRVAREFFSFLDRWRHGVKTSKEIRR